MADGTINIVNLNAAAPTRRPARSGGQPAGESYLPGGDPAGGLMPRPSGISGRGPAEVGVPVKTRSKAGYFAAGVAVTLVALVGAGAIINHIDTHPAPAAQHAPLTQAQREALRDFKLLHEVGQRDGGGLQREWLLGQRAASPEQAVQELAQGDPVFYYSARGAAPQRIDTQQQLEELAHKVRQDEARRDIREGVDQVKEGLREAGKVIQRELDDFWKEVKK